MLWHICVWVRLLKTIRTNALSSVRLKWSREYFILKYYFRWSETCRQLFLLTELLIELHSFSTLYFVSFPIPILTVVRSSSPDEMHNEFYYYGKLNFKSSYGEMYLFRIEVKCFSRILYLPKLLEFPHISSFHSYSIPSRPQIPLTIFSFLLYVTVSLSTIHCLLLLLHILIHILIFYSIISVITLLLPVSPDLSLSLYVFLSSYHSFSFSSLYLSFLIFSLSLSRILPPFLRCLMKSLTFTIFRLMSEQLCVDTGPNILMDLELPTLSLSPSFYLKSLFITLSYIIHYNSSYHLFSSSSFPLLKLIPIS